MSEIWPHWKFIFIWFFWRFGHHTNRSSDFLKTQQFCYGFTVRTCSECSRVSINLDETLDFCFTPLHQQSRKHWKSRIWKCWGFSNVKRQPSIAKSISNVMAIILAALKLSKSLKNGPSKHFCRRKHLVKGFLGVPTDSQRGPIGFNCLQLNPKNSSLRGCVQATAGNRPRRSFPKQTTWTITLRVWKFPKPMPLVSVSNA